MSDYSNFLVIGLAIGGLVLYMKSQEKKTIVQVEKKIENAGVVQSKKQQTEVQAQVISVEEPKVLTSAMGKKRGIPVSKVSI